MQPPGTPPSVRLVYQKVVSTDRHGGAVLYTPGPSDSPIRHGYLLKKGLMRPGAAVPDALDLHETLKPEFTGVYLFFPHLPDRVTDQIGFINAAANYLKHPDRNKIRFAWFSNPENWPSGLYSPQEIEAAVSGTKLSNTQQVQFFAGQYSLRITPDNAIVPNDDHSGLTFESSAVSNSFGAGQRTRLHDGLTLILANGPLQGCFWFPLNMAGDRLNALNIGLDYFWDDPDWGLQQLDYPIFDIRSKDRYWALQGFFDPLDIVSDIHNKKQVTNDALNGLRTGFTFTQAPHTSEPLETRFRTRYGQRILFTPLTEDTKDNFGRLPMVTFTRTGLDESSLSMVLLGDFHLGVARPQDQEFYTRHHLLCGLSGTETISFTAAGRKYPGDIIRFHPKKPAYSPGFSINKPEGKSKSSPVVLLDHTLTTSWISIRPWGRMGTGLSNHYFSQPRSAPLFKADTDSGNRLEIFDAPSAELSATNPLHDCFPMVPAAAAPLPDTQKFFTEFETQILNPHRKLSIEKHMEKRLPQPDLNQVFHAFDIETELSTTPQGFLVSFQKNNENKKWQSLILANEQGSKQPPLEFKQPPPYVQSAFQTNEQFLVISNPDRETLDYLKHKFQDRIDIAQWPFVLDTAGRMSGSNTTSPYRNVIIFKFCRHSLVDRLKHPERWIQPDRFNGTTRPDRLSQWILDYIQKSGPGAKNGSDPENELKENRHRPIIGKAYEDFFNKVHDPEWNGIMALQVTLDLAQLPDTVKSIAAGIDTRKFAAHHVAFNSNHILSKDGRIDTDFKSAMSGLISYVDEAYSKRPIGQNLETAPLNPVPGDFDFKVLELQVLFRNSEISDFNAKIQLSINTLFNEPVISESKSDDGAVNRFSIVLEGLYNKHDGQTAYTFRQIADTALDLDSTALSRVYITAAGLTEIQARPSENKLENTVITRFSLSGRLGTRPLEDFDMLSFDRINFFALYIDMKFDPQRPQHSKVFEFNPSGILIDPGTGKVRSDSLAAHFPISLQSFESSPQKPLPEDPSDTINQDPSFMGYQAVEAPMNYHPVGNTWYGLKFNLNLGGMGALAAKTGLEAEILLTWGPGHRDKAAQVWIKMPFSGGEKQFSLQGVVKLAIQSIRMEKHPEKPEYAMLFTNIKTSLLGLKLPPSGNTLLYLFGDPDSKQAAAAGTGNLGWFGAYKKM